jgi:hypothetical protein
MEHQLNFVVLNVSFLRIKISQKITLVNVVLKTKVSEIFSIYIIRADVFYA